MFQLTQRHTQKTDEASAKLLQTNLLCWVDDLGLFYELILLLSTHSVRGLLHLVNSTPVYLGMRD
jgi:hypothetical protein